MSFGEEADQRAAFLGRLAPNEEIGGGLTVAQICMAVLRGWWIVAACCVLGLVAAECYLANARPYFSAGFTLVPKEDTQDQGLAGQAKLLLGNVSTGKTRFEVLQLLMESDRLAEELVKRGALPLIFYKNWDATTNKWIAPKGLIPSVVGFLKREAGLPVWEVPDADALKRYISGHEQKTLMKSSNALELVFTHNNPETAYWLARNVLGAADSLYRADQNEITNGRIQHLKDLLDTENNTSYRQNLIGLLQVEEQNRMMLSSGENVAAAVVEAPIPPAKPAGPKFSLVVEISLGLGAFFGIVLSVLIYCGFFNLALRRSRLRRVA